MLTFRTRSIGRALFGVNFGPLQEIEAIMGVDEYLILGPFSRDYKKIIIIIKAFIIFNLTIN